MVIRTGLLTALLVVALIGCMQTDPATDVTDNPASRTCALSEVPEDFTLTYSYQLLNLTRDPLYDCFLAVSSNGSATANVTTYFSGSELTQGGTATLGQDMVEYLMDALEEDGVCGLEGTYNDAGWLVHTGGYRTEVLDMSASCGDLTLTFLGNAMTGIMPHTTVALGKLTETTLRPGFESLAVDVDVEASLDSDGIVTISAAVVNDATRNISLGSACEEIWPALIVKSNGCTIVDLYGNTIPMCIYTVGPGETFEFEPKTWNASGLAAGSYIVMVDLGWSPMGMAVLEVTEDLGHDNQPPRIRVSAEEKEGSEGTYVFDASASCDAEDIVTDLLVRWDWYGDGVWDTDWSYDKVAEHTFGNMSGYRYAVEVMDTDGAVSTESMGVTTSTEHVGSLLGGAMVIGVAAAAVLVAVYLAKDRKNRRPS